MRRAFIVRNCGRGIIELGNKFVIGLGLGVGEFGVQAGIGLPLLLDGDLCLRCVYQERNK